MSNLIKPAEYAKKLGISRQAVYAKIKKGVLTSKSVDGKLYIVQDTVATANISSSHPTSKTSDAGTRIARPSKDFQDLLAAKDETIGVLKDTIVDLKDTNQMITSTLRSEVDLLKEAFSEMKMLYSTQIEHLRIEEAPFSVIEEEEVVVAAEPHETGEQDPEAPEQDFADAGDDLAWIDLEDFFDACDIRKQKQQKEITKRLKKRFKKGDSRIDSFNGQLILLADVDYSDIIKKKKKHK